jgi:hypothetical protein
MLSVIAGRFGFTYPDGGGLPVAEPLVTVRPVGGLPLRIHRR